MCCFLETNTRWSEIQCLAPPRVHVRSHYGSWTANTPRRGVHKRGAQAGKQLETQASSRQTRTDPRHKPSPPRVTPQRSTAASGKIYMRLRAARVDDFATAFHRPECSFASTRFSSARERTWRASGECVAPQMLRCPASTSVMQATARSTRASGRASPCLLGQPRAAQERRRWG